MAAAARCARAMRVLARRHVPVSRARTTWRSLSSMPGGSFTAPPQPPSSVAPQGAGAAGTPQQPTQWLDVNSTSFQSAVIDASAQAPVVALFYSARQRESTELMPMLAQEASRYRGAIALRRCDAEANQQLAAALRLTSLPAVMAVYRGKAVESFVGALPADRVADFFKRVATAANVPAPVADPNETLDAAVRSAFNDLESGNTAEAAPQFEKLLKDIDAMDASNGTPKTPAAAQQAAVRTAARAWALTGLGQCAAVAGNDEEAAALLEAARKAIGALADPDLRGAMAALELTLKSGPKDGPELAELQAAVQENPEDLEARYRLAEAMVGAGQLDKTVEECLEILKRDRSWNEGEAKKLLLTAFEALGEGSDVVHKGRRRLANLLFA